MAQTNSGGQGTNGVADESPNMIVYRKVRQLLFLVCTCVCVRLRACVTPWHQLTWRRAVQWKLMILMAGRCSRAMVDSGLWCYISLMRRWRERAIFSSQNMHDMRAGLATVVGRSHGLTGVRLGSQIGGLGLRRSTWLWLGDLDFWPEADFGLGTKLSTFKGTECRKEERVRDIPPPATSYSESERSHAKVCHAKCNAGPHNWC